MSSKTLNRTAIVGFFILLGLAILVGGVFVVSVQRKIFSNSISVGVIFDDVGGLQPGNNVWLSGVKIGTVKKISFLKNTQVEILLNVDREIQSQIRKDAKAKIGSDGIIGNRIVVIYGGSPDSAMISPGDYLKSDGGISTNDVLTTLQLNNKNLLEVTGNLKAITAKIRDGQGTIGKLINDPALANSLRQTLLKFDAAAAHSDQAITRIRDFVTDLNKSGGLANELVTDTTVFASLKATMSQLNEAAKNITDFSENLRNAAASLSKDNNPAGVILTDQKMAEDLKTITRNLNSSSQKLDEDLKALQSNFLFKGYFKKQEKAKKKEEAAKKQKDSLPH